MVDGCTQSLFFSIFLFSDNFLKSTTFSITTGIITQYAVHKNTAILLILWKRNCFCFVPRNLITNKDFFFNRVLLRSMESTENLFLFFLSNIDPQYKWNCLWFAQQWSTVFYGFPFFDLNIISIFTIKWPKMHYYMPKSRNLYFSIIFINYLALFTPENYRK